jgi:hypothetical protein
MPAAARQLDRAATAASLDAASTGRWEMTPQHDGSVRVTPTSLDPARGIFVQVRGVPPPPVHPAADGTLTIEIPSPPVRVVALLEVSEGISRCR